MSSQYKGASISNNLRLDHETLRGLKKTYGCGLDIEIAGDAPG